MPFVCLLFCLIPLSFGTDLFGGLQQNHEAVTSASSVTKVLSVTTAGEKVLYQNLSQDTDRARQNQIEEFNLKIGKLDASVQLPQELRDKYRAEQKRLTGLRTRMADRFVEAKIEKSSFLEKEGASFSESDKSDFHVQAVQASKVLSGIQRENLVGGWKSSVLEPSQQKIVGAFLASVHLYGMQNAQTLTLNQKLAPLAQNFAQSLEASQSASMSNLEISQMLVNILSRRISGLSYPVRQNLSRLASLQRELGSANGQKAQEMAARKIEMEQEFLLKNLGREGFLIADPLNGLQMEYALYKWLNQPKDRMLPAWILEEEGQVLSRFDPDAFPAVQLKTIKKHGLLAPFPIPASSLSEDKMVFQAQNLKIEIEGKWDLIPTTKKEIKSGERIAVLREPSELTISVSSSEGPTAVAIDFLSFF